MKKSVVVMSFAILIILFTSFISAGWFSDIVSKFSGKPVLLSSQSCGDLGEAAGYDSAYLECRNDGKKCSKGYSEIGDSNDCDKCCAKKGKSGVSSVPCASLASTKGYSAGKCQSSCSGDYSSNLGSSSDCGSKTCCAKAKSTSSSSSSSGSSSTTGVSNVNSGNTASQTVSETGSVCHATSSTLSASSGGNNPINYLCSDSDGGVNTCSKGTTLLNTTLTWLGTSSPNGGTDSCEDNNYLWEYSCSYALNGKQVQLISTKYYCANGCKDGRCK